MFDVLQRLDCGHMEVYIREYYYIRTNCNIEFSMNCISWTSELEKVKKKEKHRFRFLVYHKNELHTYVCIYFGTTS